jgi:hypothetical protein
MKSTLSTNTKKPEDSSKILDNIRKIGNNKQCFDCGEKVKIKLLTINREQRML